MQSQITARHFDASPALRQYASDRLHKLERYYSGINGAHVILSEDGTPTSDKAVEISLSVYRQHLSAQDAGSSHEEAIDRCVERLRRQIMRYKAKLRSTDKDVHR